MSHICSCGDCEVEPFDDRCKYELQAATAKQLLLDLLDLIETDTVWTWEKVEEFRKAAR